MALAFDDDDDLGFTVELYVYDLSKGLASLMSGPLLGKHLDGIWHTGIVTYGREYFFGSAGVESCRPGGTILGEPDRVENLGATQVPYQLFLEYVLGLGESTFQPGTYDLLKHNCNNFSDDVSTFLCGSGIPKYILDLPDEVLNTTLGQNLKPLLDSLSLRGEGSRGVTFQTNCDNSFFYSRPQDTSCGRANRGASPDTLELNSAIEDARRDSLALEESRNTINDRILKKEKKKKKKEKKRKKEQEGQSECDHCSSDVNSEKQKQVNEHCDTELSEADTQQTADLDTYREQTDSLTTRQEADCSHTKEIVSWSQTDCVTDNQLLNSVSNQQTAGMEEEDIRATDPMIEPEEEKEKIPREPPICFRDTVKVKEEFQTLERMVEGVLTPEESQSLTELHQYVIEDEGSWALGDTFLYFIGRLLHDKSLMPEVRVKALNIMASAALKEDVILILHQDRREHVIMNYAFDIDRLPVEEQEALALFIVNLFENISSSEWLLYISEWQYGSQSLSNIRVTTKVAVASLLSENSPLQDRGSAIMYNLSCKEKLECNMDIRHFLPRGCLNKVFDDVATELAMAIMQFFSGQPPEEQVFRCMKALLKFCHISHTEVPQLIKMIGPEPSKFLGMSERIDDFIQQINTKIQAACRMF